MNKIISYVVTVEVVTDGIETAGVKILKQRLDVLDMRALVAVLNGLPVPEKESDFVSLEKTYDPIPMQDQK